jgi:molybdenum cofactor biosynthesis enzyme MoaA
MMCHSLYIRANGEIPCWDDVGEKLTLRTLDEQALHNSQEPPIFYGVELTNIRQSFISGRDPFPDFCQHCAMCGFNSIEPALRPRTMEVLHLEASYLCHLSCPQCIPASDRKSLRTPPYHLRLELLDGLFRHLNREGIDRIGFILFEGRGDPLLNTQLDKLIESARNYYPNSLIGLTTHGSYPYMPWIVQSGLNVLRVSIDGATAGSYSKYRVGGNFELVKEFLRCLRDDRARTRSTLRVEWKYILFEWNDSPGEMQLAAELAEELQVHLAFVRTHSPGHSKRFTTDLDLQKYIRQFLPDGTMENTFPLKSTHKSDVLHTVIAEHVAALLSLAIERFRAGDEMEAHRRLAEALGRDPGIAISSFARAAIDETIRSHLPDILAHANFPSTLSWLAALSREMGDGITSDALLSRYLELAPNSPDRAHILADRLIRAAISHTEKRQFDLAYSDLRQAISLELGISAESQELENPILYCTERAASGGFPLSIVEGAAIVALREKEFWVSHTFFHNNVELVPKASNRRWIRWVLIYASIRGYLEALRKTLFD